jgi:hypothetical protein
VVHHVLRRAWRNRHLRRWVLLILVEEVLALVRL